MTKNKLTKPGKNKVLILVAACWLGILIWTRFYNLDITAPFSYDEATDQSRMHDIFEQKKLTLVGPISTDNKKVFSSISYYLYLPFAVAGHFDIASPYWGAAFWGILTAVVLLVVANQHNPKLTLVASLLILVWTPLLITGRHAYNPNLVPFWIALAIAIPKNSRFTRLLAGICLGASIHHHYTSIIASLGYIGTIMWKPSTRKQGCWLLIGLLFGIAPLILFDITHWPGIFFTSHFTSRESSEIALQASSIIPKIIQGIEAHTKLLSPYDLIANISTLFLAILALTDYRDRKDRLVWLIPISLQALVGIATSNHVEYRYAYASIPFLFTWLLLPRKGASQTLQLSLISLIIASSVTYLPRLLTTATTYPPIAVVRQIGATMQAICQDPGFKNPNIATLQSQDADTIAFKYRWYLTQFGCHFKAPSEYEVSEQLLVISQASLEEIRHDPAAAMQPFKDAKLKQQASLEDGWQLYWLGF